jgi:hypothetical protein
MSGRSVLISGGLPLLYWTMIVVIMTLLGYAGVVLLTPLAWLLALVAGRGCIIRADDPRSPLALLGAAGSGALVGLGLGIIFGVVALMLSGLTPDEEEGLRTLALAATIAGIPVCAALAVLMGLIMRGRV